MPSKKTKLPAVTAAPGPAPLAFVRPCTFTATLERKTDYMVRPETRKWTSVAHEPKRGVVIGHRYVQDGTIFYDDNYPLFHPEGDSYKVWLVVFAAHLNPVYVAVDNLKFDGDE
jgi:hypothetical protein